MGLIYHDSGYGRLTSSSHNFQLRLLLRWLAHRMAGPASRLWTQLRQDDTEARNVFRVLTRLGREWTGISKGVGRN